MEEKVAEAQASVFIVMASKDWPQDLPSLRVYATRDPAREDARDGRTYMEYFVRQSRACPTCGHETGK